MFNLDHNKLRILSIFILAILFSFTPILNSQVQAARNTPLIIDHTSVVLFDQIPQSYLDTARNQLKISYGHTSHGSQVISGMSYLKNLNNSKYNYSSSNSCKDKDVFLCDRYPSGDLGNPDRTTWASRTRDLLNNNISNRNTIMWSWCGQHNTSSENIDIYLNQMSQLEKEYPHINFIYMTGHLNSGSGYPDGNTYLRNQQIRNYVKNNNKILFDFADIESWDPNGNDYRNNTDSCEWCNDWCDVNSTQCQNLPSCTHSHGFNCIQKGKAFWVMAAMLAGWEPDSSIINQINYSNQFSTTKIKSLDNKQYISKIEANELNQQVKHNFNLAKRVKGRMLLRVEKRGEIWYVNPGDEKKYQVTFANALYLFQNLALGITNSDLDKIPVSGSSQIGDRNLRNRLKGYLLLQVQNHGAIWYVDENGYRHSITWQNLLDVFRKLSLGISDSDLSQINYGGLEKLK